MVTLFSAFVGWIFVQFLNAVMAPGGNLGGGPGSLPPANLPTQPPSTLNTVQGPLTIQAPSQIISPPVTNLTIVSGTSGNIYLVPGNDISKAWIISANGLTAQTDNTYDIGASGANRPRNIYASGTITGALDAASNSIGHINWLSFMSGNNILMGNGVPAVGSGGNGDFYFRSDTPGTANQRIYVKSAGAWVGIV